MPRVSVIIPLYNSNPFIMETLDSVLSQSYEDMEVITVDDGSSDNTGDLVRSRGDKRLVYIRQDNAGISAARNRGLSVAKGEYIAFIDHDDKWLPGKIAKQMALFNSQKDLGLVYSDAYIVNAAGQRGGTFFKISKPHCGMVFEYMMNGNFIPVLTAVIKKSITEKTGYFDQRYKIAEDWDYFIRVSKICPVSFVDAPLAEYRVHASSFSRNRVLMLEEVIDILMKLLAHADRRSNIILKRNLSSYSSLLGSICLKSGDLLKARDIFSKAAAYSPVNIRARLGLAGSHLPVRLARYIGNIIDTENMHDL